MRDLRKAARGQPCLVRVPNVCDGGGETTIAAHYRLVGVSGIGLKSVDLASAHCCAPCHTWIDTHHDAETKVMHLEGIVRTLDKLVKLGLV